MRSAVSFTFVPSVYLLTSNKYSHNIKNEIFYLLLFVLQINVFKQLQVCHREQQRIKLMNEHTLYMQNE